MSKSERPEFCTDDMLEFLDSVREIGVGNMAGAGPVLDDAFPELKEEGESRRHSSLKARQVLSYWMHTPKADR